MENMDERDDEEIVVPPAQEESAIKNAPWWMVSAGMHVVLVLAAALIYVEKVRALETEVVMAGFREAPVALIKELERSDVTRKEGIPSDEKENFIKSTDPVIFFPEAEIGDHNESADNEDHGKMKGQSKDLLSYRPGESNGFRGTQIGKHPGVNDALGVGVGGGSSGRHGGPFGGRKNIRVGGPSGPTPATESAVTAALKWLARHQNPDGSWGAASFSSRCAGKACSGQGTEEFDAGETALSILAFLGAGYSHLSRDEFPDPAQPGRVLKFGECVRNGLKWMIGNQDLEGCVGPRCPKYLYNHSIAALALSEAYGMTAAINLKEPAQKAIDFLILSQNPGKGWRYSAKCGDNDTSVTGWAVMALKSAELSDLKFPRTAFDGALAWLNEATEKGNYYRTGYNAAGTGKVFIPGKNESFDHHESMSAVAVMSRIFIKKDSKDPALTASQLLLNDLPEWKGDKIDFYYWYYASLALFQLDGPDGPQWKRWNEPMKNALVPHQLTGKDGCANGSWDPAADRWGFEGGRVYATAINALTLEVYYRYANVFGVQGKK